ncbi:MAG: nucleoside phosphorylase [Planctomycetes bacterium]|nr:nucleoside phosphorylase [Planctomycetota bacterium]
METKSQGSDVGAYQELHDRLQATRRGICGLIQMFGRHKADNSVDDLKCDVLIFVSTQTEREQLENGARELGILFDERNDARVGTYFNLGTIGPNRVRAVKTRMGSLFHQGSASQAIILRAASSATSIIQVGMAFGIDRNAQQHGDVLVSKWIFPYDYRVIEHAPAQNGQPDRYIIDYQETKKFSPKQSLLNLLERERKEGKHSFTTHSGGILSGGSRIRSQLYLRELLAAITGGTSLGGYVGGEMEGVGLLSASKKAEPVWVVVKGISDFADDQQRVEVKGRRAEACLNAVRFVLAALKKADSVLTE